MYQITSKLDKECGTSFNLKPSRCLCTARAIQNSGDPQIREVPFTYLNCVAEMVLIAVSVATSFPLFILLIQHVRQKTRTATRGLRGTQLEAAEDSIKRLQSQNFLAQTVDPRSMYAARDLKDRRLVMRMSRRQILWRLTLTGVFRSKKFYILLTGLALNICAFVHWMYEIESPYTRQQLNMLELLLRYIGIYTVIYFVFRKASKQLIDNAVWVRGLIPTFLLSLLLMLTLLVFL